MEPAGGEFPIQCADCSTHYTLAPGAMSDGLACPECGGKRLFRLQPSPTQSEGTLRNMVDSDSQKDMGGNPLGEGMIVGDGSGHGHEKPMGKRDNSFAKVAGPDMGGIADDIMRQKDRTCPKCTSPMHWRDAAGLTGLHPDGAWECSNQRCWHMIPGDQTKQMDPQHPDPWMDNEPGTMEFPHQWAQASTSLSSVTQRVEMRPATLNMEPYAFLWSDEMMKTGGVLGLAADAVGAMPTIMKGALMGASAERDLGGGQQAGGAGPETPAAPPGPTQAQPLNAFGALLPMMLIADLETPGSVKSVGEQHDDPEKQDQKEFNDGDSSPKNLENPNLEDSGANGEDDARSDSGFGQNSPGIERAMMVMPLLLHYFQSEESGENDPIIRGLHEMLEAENPGYLKGPDHPNAQQSIDALLQQHKPHGVHAGVGSMPGGLPAVATPNSPIMSPMTRGGGSCPHCGAPLAADGSCPACGSKGGQEGYGFQAPPGSAMQNSGGGGSSMPPNAYSYQAGVNAFGTMPGGAPSPMGTQNQAPQSGGGCPSCGAPMSPDGTCPTCSGQQAQQPANGADPALNMGMGMGLGNAMGNGTGSLPPNAAHRIAGPGMPPGGDPSGGGMPPGGGMMAPPPPPPPPPEAPNSQMTPELKAALIQYLIAKGEEWRLPDVELHPENFRKEIAQIQGSDTTLAPLPPDPTQATPPGAAGGPGAMPVMDPSQPGGGGNAQMQPMSRRAADNLAPRCPECGSATTGMRDGNEGDGMPGVRCHSCGHQWKPSPRQDDDHTAALLVALVNPTMEDAADQHSRIGPTQDSSMTWQDNQGQQLMEGQTYNLTAPGHDMPDLVKVLYAHPDELGVKLVGQFANITNPGDENVPDFKITPEDMESKHYTFTPDNGQDSTDNTANPPLGGMPGLDQIPQSGQTTDEFSQSNPTSTSASVIAALAEQSDRDDDDLCDKCGNTRVDHVMSSATTIMHECFRCGHSWESRDEFDGHEAHADLSWLNNDDSWDDFDMDRAAAMRGSGGTSRNLGDVAAKDDRLQRIHEVLSSNRQEREQFHTSGRHYTQAEMRELIDENGHARNLDRLDLRGTHYETRYDHTGKANGDNVPASHLFMGLAA